MGVVSTGNTLTQCGKLPLTNPIEGRWCAFIKNAIYLMVRWGSGLALSLVDCLGELLVLVVTLETVVSGVGLLAPSAGSTAETTRLVAFLAS